MIHLVVLCKLEEHVAPDRLEEMVRAARSQLLKIGEVLQVRSGKRVDPENQWPFFYSIDCDSLEKLTSFRDDPVYVKFVETVIKPNTWAQLELVYELEPGKDIRYS
jgi:hypothetical protein